MLKILLLAAGLNVLPALAQDPPSEARSTNSAASGQVNSTAQEIFAQEQLLWKTFADGDVDGLNKLMLPDFINVTSRQQSRDEVLETFKHNLQVCTEDPIAIRRAQVFMLSPDVASIVYQANLSKTCDERTSKSDYNMTTVWVRRDGRWQMHLHTEFMITGFAVQSN